MPRTIAPFRPGWWCRNRHLQTLWPVLFRRHLRPALRRERLKLPDGDFIDLDWTLNNTGPIVILVHGLEGSSRSHYARAMLDALPRHGLRAVLMHFRGCSGEPNRLARAYHSGDTGDFDFVVRTLREREPGVALGSIGYSLGGNMLLKWLGEQGDRAPLSAAVAVSVPFLLHESVRHIDRGFARLYQHHLLKSLKANVRRKADRHPPLVTPAELDRMRNFYEFDDRITGPLHGFRDAPHYYTESSSRQYLPRIRIPTLLVHALDDPFMHAAVAPRPEELSASTEHLFSPQGGHVGFVGGAWPWKPQYWLDTQLPVWLAARLHATPRDRV